MFDKIRLPPQGIKKVNKKLVIATAAGILLITVLLFGLESEKARTTPAQQVKKEAPVMPAEQVSVESFNRLPQNYAFIQGVAPKNDPQQKQGPQTAAGSSPDRPRSRRGQPPAAHIKTRKKMSGVSWKRTPAPTRRSSSRTQGMQQTRLPLNSL